MELMGYYIEAVPYCFPVKLLGKSDHYEKVDFKPENQYWAKVNQIKLVKMEED